MLSIPSAFTALVALLTVVDASPVELSKRGKHTFHQVERKKFRKNGPLAKLKTLRKFGAEIPEGLAQAATARDQQVHVYGEPSGVNGSVEAVPPDEVDILYLSPVTAGKSHVYLDFDTGSADLWVLSSLQPKSQTEGHDIYDVSTGKQLLNYTWDIEYGDGSSASGKVFADKVVVGPITATSQAVEAATSVSAEFLQDPDTDGLLGLSFSTLNTVIPKPQKTFFDTVKGDLAAPLFSVGLRWHAPGAYDFGWVDKSKYSGELSFVDVDDSAGFWAFSADAYAIGSKETKPSTPLDVIADTGTTLSYLPDKILNAYYKNVKGAVEDPEQGGWVFPCNSSLPDFSLTIAGARQSVPAKYINYTPLETGSTTCYGGLQSSAGIPFGILGDVFLKGKYVVHDVSGETPRLGFAKLV